MKVKENNMTTAKFYKVSYQQFEEAYLDYEAHASKQQMILFNYLNVRLKVQRDMIFIHLFIYA